ncbi:MAG: hypothetical protein GY847_37020 [Proteobacteria bacterium]|nr:hypothetical protein [Pseudomonadota bacterium]
MKSLIVGSEGNGSYGKTILNAILKVAFPENDIVWSNREEPDLVVRSHFLFREKESKYREKPYLTWSGESFPVKKRRDKKPICEILSHHDKGEGKFYLPFMLFRNPERPSVREKREEMRPYFAAYISRKRISKREEMFKVLRAKDTTAHALGRCSNTGQSAPMGGWSCLTETYSKYRFVFAMENKIVPGYITEKILNAFIAGAIPIYWGHTETVERYFNRHAFINIGNFETLAEAAEYIKHVDDHSEMRNKYMLASVFKEDVVPEIFNWKDIRNPPGEIRVIAEYIKERLRTE